MCWWLARVLAVGRFEWIIFYFPFGILKSAVLPKNASIFELVRVKHVSHWALIPRRIKWTNTNSSTGESSACIRTTSIPLHSARNLIHCQPRRRARKKRQNSFSLVASTGTGYRAGGSLFHAISIFATLKATLSSLSPFPTHFDPSISATGAATVRSENICAPRCSRQHQCVSSVCRRFCTSATAHLMCARFDVFAMDVRRCSIDKGRVCCVLCAWAHSRARAKPTLTKDNKKYEYFYSN